MKPNQNLRLQLHFARHIMDAKKGGSKLDVDDAYELANLVLQLDKHLSEGGELPSKWAAAAEDEDAADVEEEVAEAAEDLEEEDEEDEEAEDADAEEDSNGEDDEAEEAEDEEAEEDDEDEEAEDE